MTKYFSLMLMSVFVLVFFSNVDFAFASSDMPYEKGITTLKNSLSGPFGASIAVIAMFVAGAAFIFGGDMTGFTKTLVGVCFAIGVMLGGNVIITKLFGSNSSGNVIIVTNIDKEEIKYE